MAINYELKHIRIDRRHLIDINVGIEIMNLNPFGIGRIVEYYRIVWDAAGKCIIFSCVKESIYLVLYLMVAIEC